MVKLLEAHYRGGHQIDLIFSDGRHGVFKVNDYLATRHGPLLGPLQDEIYLQRFFIDAGALCWPNGLELSPARLHEISLLEIADRTSGPEGSAWLVRVGNARSAHWRNSETPRKNRGVLPGP